MIDRRHGRGGGRLLLRRACRSIIHLPLALLAGALAGAAWAAIAGWLQGGDRRARGDHHDHAQPDRRRGWSTTCCATRRSRSRGAPTRSRSRCCRAPNCPSCSTGSTRTLRSMPASSSRSLAVVLRLLAAVPHHARLRVPRQRPQPGRGALCRHALGPDHRRGDGDGRARWPGWPAPTRCSACSAAPRPTSPAASASTPSPWRCSAARIRSACCSPGSCSARSQAGGRQMQVGAGVQPRPDRHHPGADHHLHRGADAGAGGVPVGVPQAQVGGAAADHGRNGNRGRTSVGLEHGQAAPDADHRLAAAGARRLRGGWSSALELLRRRHLPPGASPATPSRVPNLVVPAQPYAYVVAALLAFFGARQFVRGGARRSGLLLGIGLFLAVTAFLVWATAGKQFSLTGMLQATLVRAVPIALGGLVGTLSERVAVVNIGIEGMLLSGAFTGAVVGSLLGGVGRPGRGDHRRRPVRPAARRAGGHLPGRPDHRRRGDQPVRARADLLRHRARC